MKVLSRQESARAEVGVCGFYRAAEIQQGSTSYVQHNCRLGRDLLTQVVGASDIPPGRLRVEDPICARDVYRGLRSLRHAFL
jgi:hypothetical protein